MPWLKLTIDRRFGLERDAGPPDSILIGCLRISWLAKDPEEILRDLRKALLRTTRALEIAREEMKR